MQRRVTPELLDDDLGTPSEIAGSLTDLRHINQWFGGTSTTIALFSQIYRELTVDRLSLLEVGSGSGYVPLTAKRKLAKRGLRLDVTLLDRRWSHLESHEAQAVAADAMRLPFCDNTHDIVGCTLLAHHFDPPALLCLCREALRVARRAVVINDLIRSRMHLALVYLGLPLFRSRITWHDAPASVRAAYTPEEMRALLAGVGARRIELSRHLLFRVGVVLWK
jgi:SAM-dependent methyltransferase